MKFLTSLGMALLTTTVVGLAQAKGAGDSAGVGQQWKHGEGVAGAQSRVKDQGKKARTQVGSHVVGEDALRERVRSLGATTPVATP